MSSSKTAPHHRLDERRKSHIANIELTANKPEVAIRDVSRRNSLSPNIVSQINFGPQRRPGSFRIHDKRQSPGYSKRGLHHATSTDGENILRKGNVRIQITNEIFWQLSFPT